MRKKMVMIMAMALVIGTASISAARQCRGMMGNDNPHIGMGGGMKFEQLNLTDPQKEQVKAVMDRYQADMQALDEKIDAARQGVHDAIHADVYDEQAIRAAHKQLAAEMENRAVLRGTVFSEIRPILTPEQVTRLKETKGGKHDKMYNRGKCPMMPEE